MGDIEDVLRIHEEQVESLEASIQDWAHKHANVCGELEDLQARLDHADAVCEAYGQHQTSRSQGHSPARVSAKRRVLAHAYGVWLAGKEKGDG